MQTFSNFFKNNNNKRIITITLICFLIGTFFIQSHYQAGAPPLPYDWTTSSNVDTYSAGNPYRAGMYFKNTTNDYWYFYVNNAGDLGCKHNTTATADSPPNFSGSATTLDNGHNVYRISYVFKVANDSIYIYYITVNQMKYCQYTDGSWGSPKECTGCTGILSHDAQGCQWDANPHDQYWLSYSTGSGASTACYVRNSSDGVTWNAPVQLGSSGQHGLTLTVYNNELYGFFGCSNGTIGSRKFNIDTGWGSKTYPKDDAYSRGFLHSCLNYDDGVYVLKSNFSPGNFQFGIRFWMPRSLSVPDIEETYEVIITVSIHT